MFLYSDYQALETRMCTASVEKGGYITSIFINLEVFNDRVTPIKFFYNVACATKRENIN